MWGQHELHAGIPRSGRVVRVPDLARLVCPPGDRGAMPGGFTGAMGTLEA